MQNILSGDPDSQNSLTLMMEQDRIRANRIPGVRTVLVVLSASGMVFDTESLRQKILFVYPDSKIYFLSTLGNPIGDDFPSQVDLLIDFTGPRQRQPFFLSKHLRRIARVAIGRNVGFFRKKLYDRIFDEKAPGLPLPTEQLSRESYVQKELLAQVGIPFLRSGWTTPDLGKSIALELPPMQRL